MNIQLPTQSLLSALDVLCPMHVHIDAAGQIRHVGPTLQKMRPAAQFVGLPFLQVFDVLRPKALQSTPALLSAKAERLHMKLRDDPKTALQGIIVPNPQGSGALINLSFGISVLDAVQDYHLTNADFAATDLAIELLFLVEAKSAAMSASRSLNDRLQRAKLEAEQRAFTDSLTGLKNRRALEQVMAVALGSNTPFYYMQVDLDFFKAVNDTYGHAAGDHVLQQVAAILEDEVRLQDTVARIGGDEFAIVIQGKVSRARLSEIAQAIICRVELPFRFQGHSCEISASIGIASGIWQQLRTMDQIMLEADTALYFSKENGRGQFAFHEDIESRKSGSP